MPGPIEKLDEIRAAIGELPRRLAEALQRGRGPAERDASGRFLPRGEAGADRSRQPDPAGAFRRFARAGAGLVPGMGHVSRALEIHDRLQELARSYREWRDESAFAKAGATIAPKGAVPGVQRPPPEPKVRRPADPGSAVPSRAPAPDSPPVPLAGAPAPAPRPAPAFPAASPIPGPPTPGAGGAAAGPAAAEAGAAADEQTDAVKDLTKAVLELKRTMEEKQGGEEQGGLAKKLPLPAVAKEGAEAAAAPETDWVAIGMASIKGAFEIAAALG